MEIDMTVIIRYKLDEIEKAFKLANKDGKKCLLILDEYNAQRLT